ncbi:TBC1 domain family member 12-like isoform X1 [Diorhabda sublineata]|uniref:TBC1 domain family member 12-like isoform X1 n=1 Tax=Diorhabda sublineata TaxID=1163346 RepID=UPI0024E16245|nr:TBC1 domain family member 12-like isoform X1 [Diorhabda sublineata]
MKNYDTQALIKGKQIGLSNEDTRGNSVVDRLKSVTQYDFDSNTLRSQSLPDCSNNESELKTSLETNEWNKSLDKDSQCQKTESWFKTFRTWPERYEKLKDVESSPSQSSPMKSSNTQESSQCNYSDNSYVKNKLSFNEALQNISLAYSPITKQLHLVDNPKTYETETEKDSSNNDESNLKKLGHRRNEGGSFSSTISSWSAISDPSTSGSLIGSEDRSVSSLEISNMKLRRKSLTNFLSKHVFTWKVSTEPTSSVWKIFSKQPNANDNISPVHVVASSSALIQHERPSNLPAKSQEEDQRHKDEYKAILVAVKKKEAQTTAAKHKQQKQQLKIEERQAASTRHFIQNVLPNWNTMCSHRKTLDLWWQGLPSSVRGKVWRLAIGNELNLTRQLYDICVNRAQNRLNNVEITNSKSDLDQESSMDVIQLDISRTFPQLGIFQEGGPYSEALHSLLAAYVCYRPDVGYVQGMSYIAAILILNMEPCDAFICFSNLLNQPLHLSAFTLNQDRMQNYYKAYDEVFNHNLPKLHSHFSKSGLTPDLYLLDWIYTIFAKAMPLDIACRVWDVFLRDGFEFIFRTGLGILNLYQDTLIEMDFLQGAQFLTHLPEDISADSLFRCIQGVNTTVGKQTFSQIIEKCKFS